MPLVEGAQALRGGFGAKIRRALDQRRQCLIEQNLVSESEGVTGYHANLLQTLRRRELGQVAWQLSREFGLGYVEHICEQVESTYREGGASGDL